MAGPIGRSTIRDLGFYVVIVAVAIGVWQIQGHMTSSYQRRILQQQGGITGPALSKLDDLQQRQLDAFLEMNRLLTTFGTTLLGALGFLFFGGHGVGDLNRHRWAALIGSLGVAVSIFFGYVAYNFLISMLANGTFDLGASSPTYWAQQAHFYTFLAGVVFLADFAFQNLSKENGSENLSNATAA